MKLYKEIQDDAVVTYAKGDTATVLAHMHKNGYLSQFIAFCTLRPTPLTWLLTPGGVLGWLEWQIKLNGKQIYSLSRKRREAQQRINNQLVTYVRQLKHCGVQLAPIPASVEGMDADGSGNAAAVQQHGKGRRAALLDPTTIPTGLP